MGLVEDCGSKSFVGGDVDTRSVEGEVVFRQGIVTKDFMLFFGT